jgi:hypothetical protein
MVWLRGRIYLPSLSNFIRLLWTIILTTHLLPASHLNLLLSLSLLPRPLLLRNLVHRVHARIGVHPLVTQLVKPRK